MRWIACALALAACGDSPPRGAAEKPAHPRSLVVLGIDGMDPVITRRLLDQGDMPNLAALIARGGWSELDTTSPPQSPVAWSTFITGQGSDGHGIFDFVHRDPFHLAPYLSTSRVSPPKWAIELGSFSFPLGSPEVKNLRKGEAFWQTLEQHGVPATVVKVPANFPPTESVHAESTSGMGTPDLLGTYGTFQLVTDDPKISTAGRGILHRVDFAGKQRVRTSLSGPASPLSSSGEAMTLDLEIVRDPVDDVALVRLGDTVHMLVAGEWSDWIPIAFDPGMLGSDAPGMVKLYLRQVRPTLHLYISPINIDPLAPAMPLSSPTAYIEALARDIGRFYTQGMPEDTKAFSDGALAAPEFLQIVDAVMTETEAILDRELDRFHGGFLFVYLSSIDQASHVFFRSLDPEAPAADRAHADVIPSLYRRFDRWLGEIVARLDPETRLIVMSDHGFAPYRTKVHLNTFLAQNGYLTAAAPDQRKPGPLGHIDWSRTQAYALGLNQVFINLRGREAHGVVPAAEREMLVTRLERDLLSLRDPDSGVTAVTRIDRPKPGGLDARAPDLIVGYRRGFRSSDESALGAVGDRIFEPNQDQWSGDHCMDPSAVPGVFVANVPLVPGPRAGLGDLAPTILQFFGITPSPELGGRALIPTEEK